MRRSDRAEPGKPLASNGVSLFGFLNEAPAIRYLRSVPAPVDPPPTDAALAARWATARRAITAAPANFGNPRLGPLPTASEQYIQTLCQQQWMRQALQGAPRFQFQIVEIDPLLTYQMHVNLARANTYFSLLSNPPKFDELLRLCLPIAPVQEKIQVSSQPQSVIIRGSLNLQIQGQGLSPQNSAGVAFGFALPLVHVTRFNGRCYLHDGYHRVFGARQAGATHVPAVVRDAATAWEAGIRNDERTFNLPLLESGRPPTLRHFVDGTAQPLSMREFHRIIVVSWAEHVVSDE